MTNKEYIRQLNEKLLQYEADMADLEYRLVRTSDMKLFEELARRLNAIRAKCLRIEQMLKDVRVWS